MAQDQFKALLPPDLDARKYGGTDVEDFDAVVNWVINPENYNRIKRLIVIDIPVDATDTGSAASLKLCFCNPDINASKLHEIDFIRLIRFIRLWRKLGLTIAQTDDIITALYPPEDLPIGVDDAKDMKLLDTGFEVLLNRIGFLLQVMRRLDLSVDRDLAPLLACWAPIGTAGEHSLYAKMFLAPTVLSQDQAFADDGYGNILRDTNQFVLAHAPALRAAFSLRDAEFTLITTELKFDKSTPMTLENISAIYRHGWLADPQAQRGRVRSPHPLHRPRSFYATGSGHDRTVRAAGHSAHPLVAGAQCGLAQTCAGIYLIWNEDISGKSAPADSVVTGLARTLRTDFAAVESQFTLVDDPAGAIAKSMMELVYSTTATDFFFGLLNNTLTTTVTYSNPVGQPTLAQPILDAASGRLSYDDLRKQLIYTGVLDATTLGTIHAAVTANGNDQSLQTAVDALSNANHELVDPFFTTYPELLPLYIFWLLNNTLTTSVAYANSQPTLAQPILDAASGRLSYDDRRKQLIYTGVLDATTLAAIHAAVTANGNDQSLQTAVDDLSNANHKLVDPFFTTYPELLPLYTGYVASKDPPQARWTALLAKLLKDLKPKRKQEQALAAVTAAAGADPSFASALLQDATVLQAAKDAQAAISDLTALETPGLSAQFFLTNDLGAAPDQSVDAVATLDYAPSGVNHLPTGQGGVPIAGIWSGYVAAPQGGFYNVAVTTDPGATVVLEIGGVPVKMAKASGVWSNQSPIALTAGALTPIRLVVTTMTKTLAVRWKSTGLGWEVIPGTSLFSATLMDRFRTIYVRFLKATSLAAALSLTADEIAYLASNADLSVKNKGWLNALAVSGNPDSSTATALRDVLTAVLDFTRIKQALSPNDGRFLAVLQKLAANHPNGKSALLTLTGWDKESLDALLKCLWYTTDDLSHLEKLCRVYDAYTLVKTCGISAATLIAAMNNDPTPEIVTALQADLRAKYTEADWLAVIKPINDAMRVKQRDALVAYVLQQLGDHEETKHINTADKLFELLLIDAEMEPGMATSRIRLALSSVQLFIERCVRNLEPDVSPADIDPHNQWRWMKRYRVWQANREIFLWPENWLDPELRDDQSPFFKEALNELLQSDITDDAAQSAFLNYLTKLDGVAKLEPCGLYTAEEIPVEHSYVVARTTGAQRKYYFRRCEFNTWKPWQQIKLDIEDVPIIPFVWKHRLFLFWLKIVQQASAQSKKAADGS